MSDMLVKLYDLPEYIPVQEAHAGFRVLRAMAPDKQQVVEWVRQHNGSHAAGECDVCFSHTPVSCFLAVEGKEILGYACYNATAPDFFGPTLVSESKRGKGIGKELLLACMAAMREEGYGYAIIGSIGPAHFYEACVQATVIPDSTPGIYGNFLCG